MSHDPNGITSRHYSLLVAVTVLVAFLLREWFVLVTEVEAPIRGDIVQYVAYAWNLIHHGTFSMSAIGSPEVVPDAFRGPGYPLFLASAMLLGGVEGGWYSLALQLQVLLGTSTVLLTALLARKWLSQGWALLAGALIALWPHHIAATGALLTEVVFGFLAVLALWLLTFVNGRRGLSAALGAGLVLSYAYLVNPVMLFFPFVAAALIIASRRYREAAVVALVPLVFIAGWALRNVQLPENAPSENRVVLNFVQGSWPLYHAAYASRNAHETPKHILRAINLEAKLLAEDASAGLRRMGERIAHDPGYHAKWYLLEKPFLLWDWDIRIGAGDVYFHRLNKSPLETHPVLAASKRFLRFVNPLIFVLSGVAAVWLAATARRSLTGDRIAAPLVACFFLYVTAVHWVFQAEPRYSIPYRPEQMLLVATALCFAAAWTATRLRRKKSS